MNQKIQQQSQQQQQQLAQQPLNKVCLFKKIYKNTFFFQRDSRK